jgi:tetratricopeptide (TPR) repeat protein
MSVRWQITCARWALWLLAVIVTIVGLGGRGAALYAWVPVTAAIVWFAWKRSTQLVVRRAFVRLGRLVDEERCSAAHGLLRELRECYPSVGAGHELLRLHESTVLIIEDRADEAVSLVESIGRKRLGRRWLPWLMNNLAWALLEKGEGARAVAVARESIDLADGAGPGEIARVMDDLRARQLGTLGASLVVARQWDEALEPLRQALARGGKPATQAARRLYLGDALQALGRTDEALPEWRRAADAKPASRFSRRAAERMSTDGPYR